MAWRNRNRYLVGIFLFLCPLYISYAQDFTGIPRVSFSFDMNNIFPGENALGPRLQIYSNNKYFGKNKVKKSRSLEDRLTYTYGIGVGGYYMRSYERPDNYLYHSYVILQLVYQNRSYFEPFAGIFPGYSWGAEKDFFFNPTAGINVRSFHINRNWNSRLLQAYAQLRIEYNTLLSSSFLGVGLVMQFY